MAWPRVHGRGRRIVARSRLLRCKGASLLDAEDLLETRPEGEGREKLKTLMRAEDCVDEIRVVYTLKVSEMACRGILGLA